jgi:DNA-binding response OmpR family regulator
MPGAEHRTAIKTLLDCGPACPPSFPPAPPRRPRTARTPAVAEVVLLEDDVLLRLTLAELREDEGFAVRQAGSGGEALALLDAAPSGCVLIADRLIGAADEWTNGHAVAAEALSRRPDLGVIYISGAPEAADRALGARERMLLKPFDLTALAGLLRELLHPPAA